MSKVRRTREKPANLHHLMESTLEAHRRDIYDYASGHLNPNKLKKISTNNSTTNTGQVSYWKSSNVSASDENVPRQSSRHSHLNLMADALFDFSSGTAGALPLYNFMETTSPTHAKTTPSPIDEKLERTLFREMEQLVSQKPEPYFSTELQETPPSKPVSSKSKQRNRKKLPSVKKPAQKVYIEELKLPEVMLPCASDAVYIPPSLQPDMPEFGKKISERMRFVTTHHAGVTRKDQFQKLMDFNRNVIRHPETLEQKVRDGHKAVEHLEQKLVTRLLDLQLKNLPFGPSFERLQLYAEIWSDLTVDSSMFGDLLAEIKQEYDIYLTHLLDSMKNHDHGELAHCLQVAEDLAHDNQPETAEELRKDVEELETKCMDILTRNEDLLEEIEEEEERIEEKKRLQKKEDEENIRRMLPVRRSQHRTPMKVHRSDQDSLRAKHTTEERLKALRVDIWEKLDQFAEEKKKTRNLFVPKPVLRNLQHAVKDIEVEWQKIQQQNEFLQVSIQDSEYTLETMFKQCEVDEETARRNILEETTSTLTGFENKEENKLEYTDIHNNYKTLVEQLLGEYLKELSISEEEFSTACKQGKSSFKSLEGMFEYIWAADDFLLFKRIMTRHNLELEIQAISLSQEKNGDFFMDFPPTNPDYANSEKGDYPDEKKKPLPTSDDGVQHVLSQSEDEYHTVMRHLSDLQQKEESDLKRAIQFSKQEMERLNAQAEEEKRMLDEAIRLSLESVKQNSTEDLLLTSTPNTTTHPEPHKNVDVESKPSTSKEPEPRKKLKKTKADLASQPQSSLPPIQKPHSSSDAAADWLASAQRESSGTATTSTGKMKKEFPEHLLSKQTGIDPEELAKRKAYLQGQREKLLEAKRKKREGELKEFQSETSSKSSSASSKTSSTDELEEREKMLKARRALADRLKREVIEKDT